MHHNRIKLTVIFSARPYSVMLGGSKVSDKLVVPRAGHQRHDHGAPAGTATMAAPSGTVGRPASRAAPRRNGRPLGWPAKVCGTPGDRRDVVAGRVTDRRCLARRPGGHGTPARSRPEAA